MKELDYSDETLAKIETSVKKWGKACAKQASFAELPENAQKEFHMVISAVAEMMYSYHLQTPENWTAAALEDVLTNMIPQKLVVPESFFEAVGPALVCFIGYLRDNRILTDKKASLLKGRIKKSVPVMLRRGSDLSRHSPIKQLLMEGIGQGVDITDMEALNSFLENADLTEQSAKSGSKAGKGKSEKKRTINRVPKIIEETYAAALPDSAAKEGEQPSMEQWKRLYELAETVKKIAPWERLWDSDLITLMLPGHDEPVCCSVMGRNGECFALGVYPGFKSISELYRMAHSPKDEPPYISLFRQDCLMCNFGNRDEVQPEDREVLKALGLRFRGDNQWIYFRSMRPGYYPWFIDAKQADFLIRVLDNFIRAYSYVAEDKLEIDFDAGETILRYYSPEKKLWINTVSEAPPIPKDDRYLRVTDELLVARLNKQKKTAAQLEFDLFYLPVPVQEKKEDVPYLPRMALLADYKKGIPLDQYMANPGERDEDIVLNIFKDYVMKRGKPASIRVRSEEAGLILRDICEKTGVALLADQSLPTINALMEELLDMMG